MQGSPYGEDRTSLRSPRQKINVTPITKHMSAFGTTDHMMTLGIVLDASCTSSAFANNFVSGSFGELDELLTHMYRAVVAD